MIAPNNMSGMALLYLGRHESYRTWKGFDWDVMRLLHEKGYITDPGSKTKSVIKGVSKEFGYVLGTRILNSSRASSSPAASRNHSKKELYYL